MAALDPCEPVSWRNPDVRFSVFAGTEDEHLGTFHTEAEARACASAHRTRFASFRIQEVRWNAPYNESAPIRRIPVVGVVS
jgi:hypothetical protein